MVSLESIQQDILENMVTIAKLASNDNRNARFVCALAYVEHELDPTPILAYGFFRGTDSLSN